MCLSSIHDVEAYLRKLGRFPDLLGRYAGDKTDRSIWFEMVFAYWLEDRGIALEYEKEVNPESHKSVDFAASIEGTAVHLELVRIEHSDEVREHIEAQRQADTLFQSYGLLLNSDHKNPYFRTAAQLIRLQEKVLEKVEKFGEPSHQSISLVVVDCTNIHEGMLDDEDVRMAAYGRARAPEFQEYWGDAQLRGLFDPEFGARHADTLRQGVGGIVFVPELEPGAWDRSYIALNPALPVQEQLKKMAGFSKLACVAPAL